jgi:hypothetical protein
LRKPKVQIRRPKLFLSNKEKSMIFIYSQSKAPETHS